MCRTSPESRRAWGCDEPAPVPQMRLQCYECEGRAADCDECNGTGVVELYRCPNTYVGPIHRDACRAAVHIENGLVPGAGGLFDQPATFVDAVELVRAEMHEYEERAQEKARRDATRGAVRRR